MDAHLGLAFCVESINYTRFLKSDQTLILDHLGSILYPFAYNEAEFFSDENIALLANLIESKIIAGQSDFKDLSVSIESNLATLKRIALPENLDKEDENDQITWDLKQSLIEPLDQYVYYKTVNRFENESHADYLTIAIRKTIINAIKSLSELTGLNLIDISINQLVTEIALQKFLEGQVEGLIVLFKIAESRLESTFLWNGNYYTSHYDRLIQDSNLGSTDNGLLTKIKSKIKQIENLFEQMTKKQIKVERIFLYGDLIEEKFIHSVQENMSVVVSRLNPMQNIEKSEKLQSTLPSVEESTRYVESIGVVLDQ